MDYPGATVSTVLGDMDFSITVVKYWRQQKLAVKRWMLKSGVILSLIGAVYYLFACFKFQDSSFSNITFDI